MKENKRKSTIQLAIWTWTWVATLALASFGPRFIWGEHPLITAIAIIINVAMGVMMIIANRNFFNHSDELERKIQMESMAVTLGLTVVVGLAYSLL
jgi:zinc transporter ZupT